MKFGTFFLHTIQANKKLTCCGFGNHKFEIQGTYIKFVGKRGEEKLWKPMMGKEDENETIQTYISIESRIF